MSGSMGSTRYRIGAWLLALSVVLLLGGPTVILLHGQENQDNDQTAEPAVKGAAKPAGQGQASQKAKSEKKEKKKLAAKQLPAVLWKDPGDVASRDLVNGAGAAADAPDPNADYTFIREDRNGTSPKFYVRDTNKVEWLVKMGNEVRPETAAARFVWAVGYFTDEDYYLPRIHVIGLERLHRNMPGASLKTGIVPNVRLKRQGPGLKKVENWSWLDNPFNGTREFNGLLVMMALVNNWDLKDVNNKVYVADNERHFVVSDLGASFGKTGAPMSFTILPMPHASKGVLKDYEESKFINKVTSDGVTFEMNINAPIFVKEFHPKLFGEYKKNEKLEKGIPIDDVRWIAGELAQLTPGQIRDAFRAAGFSPEDVEGYARVVERRIGELDHLQQQGPESSEQRPGSMQ